jgi:MotA/TolQ/ExbB proton channel family protein
VRKSRVRRFLIRTLLPLFFCVLPPLAAVLIAAALPAGARTFYLDHFTALDGLIIGLGAFLFLLQMVLGLRALRWRGTSFDERPDRWLTHLAQAAEWFPLLGLIGTVAGILQTFGTMRRGAEFDEIVRLYAPALTATGSGLFAALVNILPTWIVLIGRDLIRSLSGEAPPAEPAAAPDGQSQAARPPSQAVHSR